MDGWHGGGGGWVGVVIENGRVARGGGGVGISLGPMKNVLYPRILKAFGLPKFTTARGYSYVLR